MNKHGVALVPTLIILALITVVIILFFSLATTQLRTSSGHAAGLELSNLQDISINSSIAQIRQASTENSSLWASQPGAIRTYNNNTGQPARIYKLYSATEMVVNASGVTDSAILNLETDVPADWDLQPEIFADLNQPSVDAQGQLLFPIADPRAMDNATTTPEGFQYTSQPATGGAPISGIVLPNGNGSSTAQRLPMPVRWIYQLADGSLGTLDDTKEFLPFTGQGNASEDNPIVGRLAFWTDDESTKLNLNTASEPIFWDTPRAATPEDVAYAKQPPSRNEVQRFAGHPATTALSSVFFPDRLLDPENTQDAEALRQLYDMAPRVHYNGGILATSSATKKLPVTFDSDRLYNSVDEFLLSPTRTQQPLFTTDPTRLEKLRFFLTTHSRSPETTVTGTPRISMWPAYYLDVQGPGLVGERTAFDRLAAFTTTLGGNPFYFRRKNSIWSGDDWYNQWETIPEARTNSFLSRYYLRLTQATNWGYPVSFETKYGLQNNAHGVIARFEYMHQTNQHDTTLKENGERVKPFDNFRWNEDYFGTELHGQYSTTHFENLPKPFNDGVGGNPAPAGSSILPSNEVIPLGVSRQFYPSEVGLVFVCAAEHQADGTQLNATLCNALSLPKGYKALQIAPVFEMFCPGQGYSMIAPSSGVEITELNKLMIESSIPADPAIYTDNSYPSYMNAIPGRSAMGPITDPTLPHLPQDHTLWSSWGKLNVSVPHLHFLTTLAPAPASSRPDKASDANWWVAWGGTGGRHFLNDNNDSVSIPPYYPANPDFEDTNHNALTQYSRGFYLVPSSDTQIKVFRAANTGQRASLQMRTLALRNENYTTRRHIIDFPTASNPMVIPVPNFPTNFATDATWGKRLKKIRQDRFKIPEIIDPNDVVRTFVVRHSDYRLAAMRVFEKPALTADNTVFTPHPGWDLSLPANQPATSPSKTTLQIHAFTKSGGQPDNIADGDPSTSSLLAAGSTSLVNGVTYKPEVTPDYVHHPTRAAAAIPSTYPYSITPTDTRDWDNGTGIAPDGAYWNRPDEVAQQWDGTTPPYFSSRTWDGTRSPDDPTVNESIAPNQMVPSPVMFGSIPSAVGTGIPWTTYLFRPNLTPGAGHLGSKNHSITGNLDGAPPDHALLDGFWMPVLQPYAISEPFSTAGKINMNYRIAPFTYIKRATGMHAVMKSERLLAIPTNAGQTYKDYASSSSNTGWRQPIDVPTTLVQWEDRFNAGQFFLRASEICEQFLVPQNKDINAGNINAVRSAMTDFWNNHRLTGDNTLERPYANLYPRLTTRSNTYRVHFKVQTIRKARSSSPVTFDPNNDTITGESEGSAVVERTIDPNDSALSTADYDYYNNVDAHSLDALYSWRIRHVRKFMR